MIAFKRHSLSKDCPHLVLVFLILVTVYVWSMPGTVVLEDDGFFILAAYFNSVTHPPGYPLFVMSSHLFTWLPFGSVAFRVHLASACLGGMACTCLWYLARCLLDNRIYAYVAALGLGLSRIFWSQAIIAEVYTLNVLLFLLLFILALHCAAAEKKQQEFYCKWLAFIYGLALSNHWPLILLSTPALLVLMWPYREYLIRNILKFIPFFLLGLLPYIWMVWRSHAVPEYSFYGPIHSLQDFWIYFSRHLYIDADYSLTAGWQDKWMFLLFIIRETAVQFGPFGIIFIVSGFLWYWIAQPGRLALSMTLAYLGSTLVLIMIRDVDYELFQRALFQVYPLISYVMAALWAVFGIKIIIEQLAQKSRLLKKNFLAASVTALIIGSTFIMNVPYNFRKNDFMAADYAMIILNSLEPDAVFYANADNIDGPVRYLNVVEGIRPDVTVFTGRYIYFNDRLYRPYQLESAELKNLVNDFIRNTDRPVYYVNDFPNDYAQDKYGFYTRAVKNLPSGEERLSLIPAHLKFLEFWSDKYNPVNLWERMHYNLVLSDYCNLILTAIYSEQDKFNPDVLKRVSGFTCANYQGALNRIRFALNEPETGKIEMDEYFRQAREYQDQAITKEDRARLDYYNGIYNLRLNNKESARINFQSSFRIWPHPDNPAQKMLSLL
jgi:hypothetical protein